MNSIPGAGPIPALKIADRLNLEPLQLLLRVPLEVGSHELVVNIAPVSCQGGRVRGEQQGLDASSIHAKQWSVS
jgi:hypothetical protein